MLRTWDIFDTLIARKCIFPVNVFHIIEQISQVKGFVNIRIISEQTIAKINTNYKLNDIYNVMCQISNINVQLAEKLKKLECDIEIDQAIPINENLHQVKSGDILISDMYLPEKIIAKMLDKVGLFVPVEIVVTSNGKSSNRIWQQIKEQNEYLFHTGDNEINDVKNPRLFDFDSSWTILSRVNDFENLLLNKDYNFASYLRELRLKNPFNEEIKQIYWTMFVMNIGILLLLIPIIDKIQKKYGFEYLGFCGRDVYYMYCLYKKFKLDKNENELSIDYLYYSRKLVVNSEKDLTKYFGDRIKNKKALLIDLYGTGMHLNKLREETNLNYSIMICKWMGYNTAINTYPKMNLSQNWTNIEYDDKLASMEYLNFCIIDLDREGWPKKDHLELVNRATHNSPIRMKAITIDDKIIPKVTFSEVNDTENLDVFELCMKEILNSKIQWSIMNDIKDIIMTVKSLLLIFNAHADKLIFKNKHFMQEIADTILRGDDSMKNVTPPPPIMIIYCLQYL